VGKTYRSKLHLSLEKDLIRVVCRPSSYAAVVIDLHSHVLPGLDDGATALADSVEMARDAVAAGIVGLAATPHVRDDYPTSADQMEEALGRVRAAVAEAGIALEILPGGEIALDRLERLSVEELRRFGLGGSPRHLLVEFPYSGWPLGLGERIFQLQAAGFVPVLAHPERNDVVQAQPDRLAAAVDAGALVQLTAASLDGRIGRRAQATGMALLERGYAHLLASDAHSPSIRAVGLEAAAAAVGSEELARWLTDGVPAAIVAGEAIPPRPTGSGRRLLSRLRARSSRGRV
jgi:protein-tyrosine phosphatase